MYIKGHVHLPPPVPPLWMLSYKLMIISHSLYAFLSEGLPPHWYLLLTSPEGMPACCLLSCPLSFSETFLDLAHRPWEPQTLL